MASLALKAGGTEVALRDVWRRHAECDGAARERLILNYAPMVKVLAGRLHSRLPPHVELDDLISSGLGGLLRAIERFDPAVGASFRGFAEFRIKGAMLDGLRSSDWVPRTVREHARAIERADGDLRSTLGRVPEEEELAAKLGLDVEELRRRLLQIDRAQVYSIDAPLGGGEHAEGPTLREFEQSHDFAGPQDALDDVEGAVGAKQLLAEAIGELPKDQQFVLACCYTEDLKQVEVAEVMGLSESRISQLHALALVNLRAAIASTAGQGEELREAFRS
jgi:RNA polymerase sigma factor for flagellar operon FliA